MNANTSPSILDAWKISETEVSEAGRALLTEILCEHGHVRQSFDTLAVLCRALQEFEDLQDMPFPTRGGRFTAQNYCFYESLSVLREVIISGLNGAYHCSFAGMRSSLELIVAHYWWKTRALANKEHSSFYLWLSGDLGSTPFASIRREVYASLRFPEGCMDLGGLEGIYKIVNAYAHRTILKESITTLQRSNSPSYTHEGIAYWADIIRKAVLCQVHLCIAERPICLFPVDVLQKFGFNGPIGVFFDFSNYKYLCDSLGEEVLDAYRQFYWDDSDVRAVLDWYDTNMDLSDDDILRSYSGPPEFDDANLQFEERVIQRWMVTKAKLRAISRFFAYDLDGPTLSNVEDIIREHFGEHGTQSFPAAPNEP